MVRGSNYKSGTQLVKSDSELLRQVSLTYYRGAMGILLVYDVTDESSFNNIRNWIRNIEQHASDNVNKILVGNKADMDESKRFTSSQAKSPALSPPIPPLALSKELRPPTP
ncbi:ras-related protein RAB1BV-like [Gossypium raimondii]|uniref:ras-related protein RAB1BV-like n=1 Tax=Gossypium raimondii TaxID=29730 RepID=UPI00227A0E89|nr:ras-related protein RAB1BV-like [Gossypium raimondii]